MKSNFLVIGGILVILIVGGFFYFKSQPSKNTNVESNSASQKISQPSRQAEINGYIISAEGNEVLVANEIGLKVLTNEEKAARQQMTPEERQALKAQETKNLEKENVSLIIPVGTTIVKGAGDGSGKNVTAEISELVKGVYVSIWKSGDNIEFIKLKGLSGE